MEVNGENRLKNRGQGDEKAAFSNGRERRSTTDELLNETIKPRLIVEAIRSLVEACRAAKIHKDYLSTIILLKSHKYIS